MSDHDTPIRLLQVIARLNVGGPAIYVTLIGHRLRAKGYDAQIVCGNIDPTEGDMTWYARDHGLEPRLIPELGRSLHPLRDLITIVRLYRLMRQTRPHIVHTNTAKAGFVGRMAAWAARVPVIVHTSHGHVFHGYFGKRKTQLFIWLERLAARCSDQVITITDSLRDDLAEKYRIAPKSQIAVMPYGLDLDPYAQVARRGGSFRAAWSIAPDAPLVGIAGRLVPIKNHALFLEAAARIHTAMPSARFVIIGDGELRADLEARVDALGLREAVVFTGWQRDMPAIYADLDALVISSHNEGTPFTLIEAMAAGCPVVSTDVGGVADLLRAGAWGELTPPGDPDALAGAIVRTLQRPPDMEPIRAAAIEAHGVDRAVRDMEALYRTILANPRRGRRQRRDWAPIDG
jgi:glycosyltransferase involved in cell wall biosynthesis